VSVDKWGTSVMTEKGPSIGTYKDREIPAYIITGGHRYEYDRIAVEGNDGGAELSQLGPNERVIAPGLIYRRS